MPRLTNVEPGSQHLEMTKKPAGHQFAHTFTAFAAKTLPAIVSFSNKSPRNSAKGARADSYGIASGTALQFGVAVPRIPSLIESVARILRSGVHS
jgi:hypothetical protein